MEVATGSTPLLDPNVVVIPEKNENDVIHNRVQRHFDQNHAHNNRRNNKNINPESDVHEQKAGFTFFFSLSRRNKYTLLLLTMANFLAGCAFSLLGPFYPVEAAKKGMTQTVIGLVFGIYEAIVCMTAPLFGSYLTTLGPRLVFLSGIFLGGCCNILFGTLYLCPSGLSFTLMSVLVRSVEAIGFSGYITASLAIVSNEFKENIGFAFSLLETGSGLGFMLGPVIGGALYQLGGFGLPFYCAGIAVLLNGVLAWNFLPPIEEDVNKTRKGSMLGLLRSPMVVIPMLSNFVGVMGIATFDSTFAKHLEPLNLSSGIVGLLFSIQAFVYSIISTFWGYLSDTKDIQSPLIIIGNILSAIAFFIFGPSVFFPFISFNLWTICIGLVLFGFSYGCALIPTMKCMVIGATELGFENSINTYALVSGLFNSIHTLGGFVGPVCIGALVQEYDFPIAYTVVSMCFIFVLILSAIFFAIRNFRAKRSPYDEIKSIRNRGSFLEDPEEDLYNSFIAFKWAVSVAYGSPES